MSAIVEPSTGDTPALIVMLKAKLKGKYAIDATAHLHDFNHQNQQKSLLWMDSHLLKVNAGTQWIFAK